jgi:hypothetical protein
MKMKWISLLLTVGFIVFMVIVMMTATPPSSPQQGGTSAKIQSRHKPQLLRYKDGMA